MPAIWPCEGAARAAPLCRGAVARDGGGEAVVIHAAAEVVSLVRMRTSASHRQPYAVPRRAQRPLRSMTQWVGEASMPRRATPCMIALGASSDQRRVRALSERLIGGPWV